MLPLQRMGVQSLVRDWDPASCTAWPKHEKRMTVAAPFRRTPKSGRGDVWSAHTVSQFSCSVVSNSLGPHGLQHPRPPCPAPAPGVHSDSHLSSQWCHPAISSSVIPFSSCLQSFPTSGSFLMSQFFTSGGHSIGVSASASVLPMTIQDWFPFGWTGWISLQSKGLSRVFSNTTVLIHNCWAVYQWDSQTPWTQKQVWIFQAKQGMKGVRPGQVRFEWAQYVQCEAGWGVEYLLLEVKLAASQSWLGCDEMEEAQRGSWAWRPCRVFVWSWLVCMTRSSSMLQRSVPGKPSAWPHGHTYEDARCGFFYSRGKMGAAWRSIDKEKV